MQADGAAKLGRPPDPALLEEQGRVQPDADRLYARQQLVEQLEARLRELTNEERDAGSLEFNIRTLSDHLFALLAFSVVFGVVLSQVSRLLFINGLYDRLTEKTATPVDVVLRKEYDELKTNYLRYVEGSINMVPPVLMFGLVFPRYANSRLGTDVSGVLWALAGLVLSALLVLSGYMTYRSYRQKVNQLQGGARREKPAGT